MARILVVDDEDGIREFLAEALGDDGHVTVQAADGVEASKILAGQSFDLLITDLRMPRLDGMALLRKVRAEQPEVEVIVMTAYGSVESAVEAMRLGAFDYLQKPISSPGELRLLAARALERRSLLALRDRSARDQPAAVPLTYGDPAMATVVEDLRKVARTHATVLLLGDSGTGKEVAARAVHRWSPRNRGPFVAVNCAAISETLLESELFGHQKGAFTGATGTRRGRLELAAGGTLFLDEIAEMNPELQAKLLRILEQRRFERLGGSRTLEADVRWIAATNRDVDEMLAAGDFREDLYHRLAVFPVFLPTLRERRGDLLPLATTLLERIGRDLGRPGLELDDEAGQLLLEATWPGNVRELANALERAAILAPGTTLGAKYFASRGAAGRARRSPQGVQPLAELEREAIQQALAKVGGHRKQAAELLDIGLRTLYEKLKRYGIS